MTQQTADMGGGLTATWDNEVSGPLTITYDGSGTGVMNDYTQRELPPWNADSEFITGLDLSNVVGILRNIGAYAFYNLQNLTGELNIPGSVTAIGGHAFTNCKLLTGALIIPDNVETIGSSAFGGCAFTSFELRSTVITTIGASAFGELSAMTGTLTLPASLTSLGGSAFMNCSSLTGDLEIPPNLAEISENAFRGCAGLTSVSFSNATSLTKIGSSAFAGCTGLNQTLVLPEGINTINSLAFSGCTGLTGSIIIPSSMTILNGVFQGCTGIISVIIGDGHTDIPSSLFSGCTGLTSVSLPNSITTIGQSAFERTGITGLTLPASLTSIGHYAFRYCDRLTGDMTFPMGLTTIGNMAFKGCNSYSGVITFLGNRPTTLGNESFNMGTEDKSVFAVVKSKGWASDEVFTSAIKGDYTRFEYGIPTIDGQCGDNLYFSYNLGTQILTITGTGDMWGFSGGNAPWFDYRDEIKEIQLPSGLTSIGLWAFGRCTAFSTITIPASVTEIGTQGFWMATGLQTVIFEEGSQLTRLANDTFDGCSKLSEITLVDGLSEIGPYCFWNCKSLGSIVIPASVTTIGNNAFKGCDKLANVSFRGNVGNMGEELFSDCIALTKADITPLVNIPRRMFYNTGLTEITFGDNLTLIGEEAFAKSKLSNNITITSNVSDIRANAFAECVSLDGKALIFETAQKPKTSDNTFNIGTEANPVTMTVSGPDWVQEGVFTREELGLFTTFVYEQPTPSGQCGDNLYWEYDTDKKALTITGTGDMWNYSSDVPVPWKEYMSDIEGISFPEGMTSIGTYAFSGLVKAISITIPSTVTEIRDRAFVNSMGLVGVSVANDSQLTHIRNSAFSGCGNLASFPLPQSLTYLDNYAFWMSGLTDVRIPKNVNYIGQRAYDSCDNLQSVAFEGNVTTLDDFTFSYCAKLTEVDIKALTVIGEYMFAGCPSLATIEFGESLAYIARYALMDCPSLSGRITFPASLMNVGIKIFKNDYALDNGEFVFLSPNKFETTALTFDIGDETHDVSINVSGADWVVEGAFTKEELGDHTTFIYSEPPIVEGQCGDGLTYAYSVSTHVLVITHDGVGTGEMWDYGEGSEHGENPPWYKDKENLDTLILTEGVKTIGKNAFRWCDKFNGTITMPQSLMAISDYSFYGCSELEHIVFNDNIMSIGQHAFDSCFRLGGELVLPANLQAVSDYAFFSCSGIETIMFRGPTATIGQHAFEECQKVAGIKFAEGLTTIGEYAFYDCKALVNLELPSTVLDIGGSAFENTGIGGEITFPDALGKIGADAFKDCIGIKGISFGAKLSELSNRAFEGCIGLDGGTITFSGDQPTMLENCLAFGTETNPVEVSVKAGKWATPEVFNKGIGGEYTTFLLDGPITGQCGDNLYFTYDKQGTLSFNGSGDMWDFTVDNPAPWDEYAGEIDNIVLISEMTSIGDYAFINTAILPSIALSDNIRSIGAYAFSDSGITAVKFNNGLDGIKDMAFMGCGKLSNDITLPASLTYVGKQIFKDCVSLNEKTITFNSAQKFKTDNLSFDIGNENTKVSMYVKGPSWVREGVFSPQEMGDYTKFVYQEVHDDYLCFVPMDNGCTVAFETTGSKIDLSHIKYSFDKKEWTSWEYSNRTGQAISVPMGQTLYVWNENDQLSLDTADNNRFTFVIKGQMECHGNVMSLINFTELKDYCFNRLFMNCKTMLTAPELPATELTQYCYQMMFYNCASLKVAPILPATVLAKACYGSMFSGCTSLTTPPELPATKLVDNCYSSMFYNCTSLASAPILSATELVTWCYNRMFYNCSSLRVEENGTGTPFFVCPLDVPASAVSDMFAGTGGAFAGTPTGGNIYDMEPQGPITGQCGDNLFYEYERDGGVLKITGSGDMWDYSLEELPPWYVDKDKLTSVSLPQEITKIGYGAFYQCSNFTGKLTLPSSVTVIAGGAFSGTGYSEVSFPSALQEIGYGAFYECANLTGPIVIPDKVKVIGGSAFYGIPIKSLVLGNGVQMIGEYAFGYTKIGGSLTLPKSLEQIGEGAFEGCVGLNNSTLIFLSDNPPKMAEESFSLGTEKTPVVATVRSPGWASDDVFTPLIRGLYTTFVYPEPPKPIEPSRFKRIQRVGWYHSAEVNGTIEGDYVMGGIDIVVDFVPNVVLGCQCDYGHTAYYDMTTRKLRIFGPDGQEGVFVPVLKYTIVLMKQ